MRKGLALALRRLGHHGVTLADGIAPEAGPASTPHGSCSERQIGSAGKSSFSRIPWGTPSTRNQRHNFMPQEQSTQVALVVAESTTLDQAAGREPSHVRSGARRAVSGSATSSKAMRSTRSRSRRAWTPSPSSRALPAPATDAERPVALDLFRWEDRVPERARSGDRDVQAAAPTLPRDPRETRLSVVELLAGDGRHMTLHFTGSPDVAPEVRCRRETSGTSPSGCRRKGFPPRT